MKILFSLFVVLAFVFALGCSTSDTATTPGGGTTGGGTTSISSALATAEAVFGQMANDAIPDGMKTATSTRMVEASLMANEYHVNALEGTCANNNYENCNYISQSGGADSQTGEIIMKVWAMDYDGWCTQARLDSGECFAVYDSTGNANYRKPTMLSDPSECSNSNGERVTVNFGVDPCQFDSMIAGITNIGNCNTLPGVAFDISPLIPFYEAWSIPRNVNFQGFQKSGDDGYMYWTVEAEGSRKYFIAPSATSWFFGGYKDTNTNYFMMFGTGSQDYYENNNEDRGVNISAYAGGIPQNNENVTFETLQVRSQGNHNYIKRTIANATHVWFQSWAGDGIVTTDEQVNSNKSTPADNRCMEIGAKVEQSKYVPFTDCYTAFSKADLTAMNDDDNFILKLISYNTMLNINFYHRLTTDSANSNCFQ